MRPFTRRKRGRIFAVFADVEARLLVNLTGQISALLEDRHPTESSEPDPLAQMVGSIGPSQPPEDPVLQRLLPDAYRRNPEEAEEFRRMTEHGLAEHKKGDASLVVETLVGAGLDLDAEDGPDIEVELDADSAIAWARALNDVRLALSVRLGIETEEDADRIAASPSDSEQAMIGIYEWLGAVQESLIGTLR